MISIKNLLEKHTPPIIERTQYSTGMATLDALLKGGVSAGQTLEFFGPQSSGKSGTVFAVASALCHSGYSVLWVDIHKSLMPVNLTTQSSGHLWVAHPPKPHDALFCAEVMIRSQSFALVVLDGSCLPSPKQSIRLQRLARQSGTAFIILRNSDRDRPVSSVNGRLEFKSQVDMYKDELSRRHPFSWRVEFTHRGVHSPGLTQSIQVSERTHAHACPKKAPSDRSTRPARSSQRARS